MNTRYERIANILQQNLKPVHMELENESHTHSVPANSETHFKLLMVAEAFAGLLRIDRQRQVNNLLASEFTSGLHALTLRLLTPDEWQKQQAQLEFVSPNCHGGSKRIN